MNHEELHNFVAATQENICQITALKNGVTLIDDTWHDYKTTDDTELAEGRDKSRYRDKGKRATYRVTAEIKRKLKEKEVQKAVTELFEANRIDKMLEYIQESVC